MPKLVILLVAAIGLMPAQALVSAGTLPLHSSPASSALYTREPAAPAVRLASIDDKPTLSSLPAPSTAPDATRTLRAYDDWRVECVETAASGKRCAVLQDVYNASDGAHMAQLAITRGADGTELVVMLPFNVLLPAGWGFALNDDLPELHSYRSCDARGCLGTVTLDPPTLDKLRSATRASLLCVTLEKKQVVLPFSAKGFGRAYDAFVSTLAPQDGGAAGNQ